MHSANRICIKNIFRKLLVLTASSFFILSLTVTTAHAETAQELVRDGIRYSINGETAAVVGYEGNSSNIIIADNIDGVPVTIIQAESFSNCSTIQTVKIPCTVTRIEDGTYFLDWDTMQYISKGAFGNCSSLRSVEFEKDSQCTYIGECTFTNCSQLDSVVLPTNLKTIALSAFENCTSLKELNLPEGLTRIGQNALSNTGITSLVLPRSIEYINDINYMYKLEEISVDGENSNWRSEDGILYAKKIDGTWDLYLYPWGRKTQVYTVPSFVENFECIAALNGHYQGGSVYVPLPYLQAVDIGMRSIEIPGFSVYKIIVDDDNPFYTVKDDILYSKDMTTVLQIPRCIEGNLTIPNGVTKIADRAGMLAAFSSIDLPDSLTEIEEFAFCYNPNLTSIVFPSSIESIPPRVLEECASLESVKLPQKQDVMPSFSECSSLKSIVIPDSITSISDYTFWRCEDLSVVYIPKSVTSIGNCALNSSCPSMCTILYEGTKQQWRQITITGDNDQIAYAYVYYEVPAGEELIVAPSKTMPARRFVFQDNGAIQEIQMTGWKKIDGNWYYLDNFGFFHTGWQKIDGKWYYFNTSGVMQKGWQKVDGKWYYLNPGGDMVTGWKKIANKWYYFNSSGIMQTGWKDIGSKTYYFKPSGEMAAGEWCKGWWLNKDGCWVYPYKASWKQNSKGWYYEDTSGWYAKNTTQIIDGKTYTFNSKGYLVE